MPPDPLGAKAFSRRLSAPPFVKSWICPGHATQLPFMSPFSTVHHTPSQNLHQHRKSTKCVDHEKKNANGNLTCCNDYSTPQYFTPPSYPSQNEIYLPSCKTQLTPPPPSFLSQRSTRNFPPSISSNFLQMSPWTPKIIISIRLFMSSMLFSNVSTSVRGSAMNWETLRVRGFSRARANEYPTVVPIPIAEAPTPRKITPVLWFLRARKTPKSLRVKAIF